MTSTAWPYPVRSLGLCSALVAASACTSRLPGEETDGDDTTTTPGSATDDPTVDPPTTTLPTTDGPTSDTTPDPTGGPLPDESVVIGASLDADILFVIDNSASMAGRQAKLAAAIPSFLDRINGLNYRIGVTTTDSGNPRCAPEATTPELGTLVLSSCLDRVAAGEFEIEGLGEDHSSACTDHCALADANLPIKPTATHLSNGELAPRKWIERTTSQQTNLPGQIEPAMALQCFIPQGVAGCGMESHLESMFRALARANDVGSPENHGFIRPQASLSVIMVSDETDCSVGAFPEIFTTNKIFWEDPDAPAPTSAACWNAGVLCTGNGPLFDDCFAENFGVDGTAGVPDDQAVLQPRSRYIDFLQAIEDQKKIFDPGAEVRLMMITGVPLGYDTFDADIIYEDSPDPQFQTDFGIGPGCFDLDANAAVPPVREREVAEAFAVGDTRDLYSICTDSYENVLADIGDKIASQIRPGCMPRCVADVDPSTPMLEPNCQLFEVDLTVQTRAEVVPCIEVDGQWAAPGGASGCFAELIDRSGDTPSPIDDMSDICRAEGFNLEFTILRTVPVSEGVIFEATCQLSANPVADCPEL